MSTELVQQTTLLDVTTGELLPAVPDQAAQLLAKLRGHKRLVDEVIHECEHTIAEESVRQGTKSLTLGGVNVEVYGGPSTEWDVGFLRSALEDAGCPDDRIEALIQQTITFKVDRRVERQLASANEAYREALEAAKSEKPGATRVRVKQ